MCKTPRSNIPGVIRGDAAFQRQAEILKSLRPAASVHVSSYTARRIPIFRILDDAAKHCISNKNKMLGRWLWRIFIRDTFWK